MVDDEDEAESHVYFGIGTKALETYARQTGSEADGSVDR